MAIEDLALKARQTVVGTQEVLDVIEIIEEVMEGIRKKVVTYESSANAGVKLSEYLRQNGVETFPADAREKIRDFSSGRLTTEAARAAWAIAYLHWKENTTIEACDSWQAIADLIAQADFVNASVRQEVLNEDPSLYADSEVTMSTLVQGIATAAVNKVAKGSEYSSEEVQGAIQEIMDSLKNHIYSLMPNPHLDPFENE